MVFEGGMVSFRLFLDVLRVFRRVFWKVSFRNVFIGGKGGSFS